MRSTTCHLVKKTIPYKNSLICNFVIQYFQSLTMIGLANEQFTISANQMLCQKVSSAQGINRIMKSKTQILFFHVTQVQM